MTLFTSSLFLAAQTEKTDKQKDIERLLVLTGSAELGMQVMAHQFEAFKQMAPYIPENFWVNLKKEVNASELVEIIIPIYDKHLSHADIKELINFYESPVGKKLVEKLPIINQEAMIEGQKWGQKIAEKTLLKIQEESEQHNE